MIMSRISKAYFPNNRPSSLSSQFYASIFIRDVHTGIMPYKYRQNSNVIIELCKTNRKLADKLKEFLYVGHYSAGWNLSETITDSIEAIAHYVVALGDEYFEIVDTTDTHKDGLTDKKLERLPSGKIFKVFNKYIQLVPLSDWRHKEKKIYVIPADRIWHIKLPRKLGSPRSHRKLLKKLAKLSSPRPEFTHKDGDLGQSAYYNFMLHHDKKELAVEQLMTKWGSIPSLKQLSHTTEYYYIIRNLQFSYSKALLREHILSEINDLIKRLGIDNEIMMTGVGTSTDITEVIKKLDKGEIGFSEALKAAKDLG